jgi:hypothetical protein
MDEDGTTAAEVARGGGGGGAGGGDRSGHERARDSNIPAGRRRETHCAGWQGTVAAVRGSRARAQPDGTTTTEITS